MKIIYNCWFALCMLLLITSCNDEWKDEQYRQYISFKAPIKDKDNLPNQQYFMRFGKS